MSTARCRPGPVRRDDRRKAERLLADNLVAITARAIELAVLGDPIAIKTCLDRCWPVPQVPDASRQGDRP